MQLYFSVERICDLYSQLHLFVVLPDAGLRVCADTGT